MKNLSIYNIIEKKANNHKLTYEEMEFFIQALCSGELPDYQTAALVMAIYINSMETDELSDFTKLMAVSGEQLDLSGIKGVKVDKHSTGGIGDKTTLIIGPIIAACGGKMAKMSGRGLGYSGGTIDKLEAIPSFKTALEKNEFISTVNELGMAITSQTADIAAADKKIYAIRDVTATVSSIPLIASSVMSKKLASGADKIVLDVKMGSGAFVKTMADAVELAETMVAIGNQNGKETVAFITNMNRPLGKNVGNLLEVQEAAATLRGEGPDDLTELCIWLAAQMLHLSGVDTIENCISKSKLSVQNGSAAAKFKEFVEKQGGIYDAIEDPERYYKKPERKLHYAKRSGYFSIVSSEAIGKASVLLGAGRIRQEDTIDYTAGIVLQASHGQYVEKGDLLFTAYAGNTEKFEPALPLLEEAYVILEKEPDAEPIIMKQIGGAEIKY